MFVLVCCRHSDSAVLTFPRLWPLEQSVTVSPEPRGLARAPCGLASRELLSASFGPPRGPPPAPLRACMCTSPCVVRRALCMPASVHVCASASHCRVPLSALTWKLCLHFHFPQPCCSVTKRALTASVHQAGWLRPLPYPLPCAASPRP